MEILFRVKAFYGSFAHINDLKILTDKPKTGCGQRELNFYLKKEVEFTVGLNVGAFKFSSVLQPSVKTTEGIIPSRRFLIWIEGKVPSDFFKNQVHDFPSFGL